MPPCWRRFIRSSRVMAEAPEVSATWLGGYRARVDARGHEIAVDEPVEDGGSDNEKSGMDLKLR